MQVILQIKNLKNSFKKMKIKNHKRITRIKKYQNTNQCCLKKDRKNK